MVVYKIKVMDSRELTRTDIWDSGVEMICFSYIEGILKCVVKHIATDLCFKTIATHLLWLVCRSSTNSYTVVYIKMVHISKFINITHTVLF